MIDLAPPLRLLVDDPSAIGEARRFLRRHGAEAGFSEEDAERAALIASELGTNLIRHATGAGDLVLRVTSEGTHGGERGLEILAMDRGPGIPDPARALADGYTSRGGIGIGLGAVRRAADRFDLHTGPRGTVVFARVGVPASEGPRIGALQMPKPGEQACGDRWTVRRDGAVVALLVVDGLGHGIEAAEAATEAVRAFSAAPPPAETLRTLHSALATTRGAAAFVLRLDLERRRVRSAGIGNVTAFFATPSERRSLLSFPGIVGHRVGRIREQEHEIPDSVHFVLATDGLRSDLSFVDEPGAAGRDPALQAGLFLRDFERGTDDATVVVARC